MGFLNQPYTNTTLGIDLNKETRPYIFFNSDDKFGVLNRELFLIVRNDGSSNLYKYQNNNKTDFIKVLKDEASQMNEYARSNLQVFQHILKRRK